MEQLSIEEIVLAVEGSLINRGSVPAVSSVCTDSKKIKTGALFVPIIGEKADAHKYIDDAFLNGAEAVFLSHETGCIFREDKTYIQVKDTKAALQQLAGYYRRKFELPIIGITGSVGKTTTKEMIAAALSTQYEVLKTAGNQNSQVGVALMMFEITKEHQIAVIEMGISEEGEMERLAKVAKPDVAVITNIGVSHIAQLKSQENIRKEKMNIINEFMPGRVLYVNGDDKLLREVKEKTQTDETFETAPKTKEKLSTTKIVLYGTEDSCGYYADEIKIRGNSQSFCFHYPVLNECETFMKEEVTIPVLGLHNVQNAVAALAIADLFDIPPKQAKVGLSAYQPIAMRGEVKEKNGVKIIDDTYNASPDSMKSGIDVLLSLYGTGIKAAVLGDILELGIKSRECHYEVGVSLKDKAVDILVTVGEEAGAIADAVEDHEYPIEIARCRNNEEAVIYLKNTLKEGDAALIKGSRGMHMEEIVSGLING